MSVIAMAQRLTIYVTDGFLFVVLTNCQYVTPCHDFLHILHMMKDIFNDIFSPAAGAEVSIIPVMQGEGLMKINESDLPDYLPILALRNAVLFPGSVYPITIGRDNV